MEQFGNFAIDCERKRKDYLEMVEKDQVTNSRDSYFFENEVDTFEDLVQIGEKLHEIFKNKSEVAPKFKHQGIPGELFWHCGEKFGNSKTEEEKERPLVNDKEPFVNFENVYFQCLDVLKENGFQVTKIKINPENFHNRNKSCLGHEGDVFEFKCSKNDYVFDVIFSDDCDCFPGILGMYNLVHVPSNKQIAGYACDLFCQNTSEFRKQVYCDLLNFGEETVLQKHYGFLYEIKNHLKCEMCDKGSLDKNSYYLDFYLKMKINDKTMRLIPIRCDGHFVLTLVPEKYSYQSWNNIEEIEFDTINDLGLFKFYEKNKFEIKVDDTFSFTKLDKMLENYAIYSQDKLGFFDPGTSRYLSKQFLHDIVLETNVKHHCNDHEDYLTDKIINTEIVFCPGEHQEGLYENMITNGKYLSDCYSFHFTYVTGNENAELKISGKYCDIVDVCRNYYKSKILAPFQFCEIGEPLVMTGNLVDLADHMVKFVKTFLKKDCENCE